MGGEAIPLYTFSFLIHINGGGVGWKGALLN